MRWLALLFLLVPLVELWLLFRVGDVIGFWSTVALVIGTAMVGAWLAKREGLRVFHSWRRAMAEMRAPDDGVTSGVLVLVGAVLLLTPGVLTDIVGLCFLVPVTRRLIAPVIERWATQRFFGRAQVFDARSPAHRSAYVQRSPRVIDVEARVIDE